MLLSNYKFIHSVQRFSVSPAWRFIYRQKLFFKSKNFITIHNRTSLDVHSSDDKTRRAFRIYKHIYYYAYNGSGNPNQWWPHRPSEIYPTCTYLTSSNVRKRQVPFTAVLYSEMSRCSETLCNYIWQLVPFWYFIFISSIIGKLRDENCLPSKTAA